MQFIMKQEVRKSTRSEKILTHSSEFDLLLQVNGREFLGLELAMREFREWLFLIHSTETQVIGQVKCSLMLLDFN